MRIAAHAVATITTRILSRALQQGTLKWSVKPELLAAATNTIRLAIGIAVFGIDRGVTGRAIVRPRRAIPNLPLRFDDNAILLVWRRNNFR
jgi:hypothetical protein